MRSALLASLLVLANLTCLAQEFTSGPYIDAQMQDAVATGLIPGGVVLVGQGDRILFQKAYGKKWVTPPSEDPMTVDTIFDAASLTKVVATTTAIARLFEQGKIRLSDPVTNYLPEFQGGKSSITVRDLLVHFSGLRPDVDLVPKWSGYDTGINLALIDKPTNPPGTRFVYSDINFLLLGEMVRRISGKPLDVYCREEIFLPLGMFDSTFNPPGTVLDRIAPTEIEENDRAWQGVVHDPTARYMGGVAGHAGLFTTATDLSKFARMMLAGGGTILQPLTVRRFTSPNTPAGQPILRGLGWDMESPFSGNRGELFPVGSFGHTGFTGTSIWMDPATKAYVIVLTNYVHPKRGKSLTSLRGRIATISAAALGVDTPGLIVPGYNETSSNSRRVIARNGQVQTGLDVMAAGGFAELRGKKVGVITNHTGIDRNGKRNVDLMKQAGVQLAAIYSPEHGLYGRLDEEHIEDTRDEGTGVKVYSLYQGEKRKLPENYARQVDAIVFDIQDIGARFYTYSCTMLLAMETAAKLKLPFYVLDRPNPITGVMVDGPMMDRNLESFVGCYSLPVRHGLTFGELATMANAERKMGVDLKVIQMKGWQRGDWFDSTGLPWVNPSPNMKTLNAATLYTGIALLEYQKTYSVGRGTDSPFEQIGADWISGPQLSAYLNSRMIPGVRTYPVEFQPNASNFSGKKISGVRFLITDREAFLAGRLGLEVAAALIKLYPGKVDVKTNAKLIGNQEVMAALERGDDPRVIYDRIEDQKHKYLADRARYLLYR
ncbi:hypothetical protein F183_A33280 [Bryobacterales bacterium F-183]|nr:hypothetical protein F183_A33280 [Bryobacterales bacterium F-183]